MVSVVEGRLTEGSEDGLGVPFLMEGCWKIFEALVIVSRSPL